MMKQISKQVLFLAALCTVFTACGGGGSGAGGGEAQVMGSKIAEIKARGKLIAGVALGGIPMGFYDDAGNPSGYDTDWAKRMAETLEVELEVVEVDGETRLAALTSGRIDVAFANITGNLTRAQIVGFSIPYLRVGIKMLTTSASNFRSIDDLNDPNITVAVGRGTTGEDLVLRRAPQANLVYVNSFTEQVLQLEQGKCDAAFEDSILVDYAAKNSNGVLAAPPELYSSDPICVGVPLGDPHFLYWVNEFVSWNITQGFQKATYEKWWGEAPAELAAIW
jgi:polar amino acid transport system substrate-binding protein